MAIKIRWPLLFQVINDVTSKFIARDTLVFKGVTLETETPDLGVVFISGAPIDATYLVGAASADLASELVLGSQVIMKGTLAARPAAGLSGRLYYVNDAGDERVTRDTGAAWDDLLLSSTYLVGGSSSDEGVAQGYMAL